LNVLGLILIMVIEAEILAKPTTKQLNK